MRTYMQKFQARRAAGEKGFTLIELLVVIVIIGILAAIAVPVFLSQRANAYDASLKSDVTNAAKVMEGRYVEGTGYTALTTSAFQISSGNNIEVCGVTTTGFGIKGTSTNASAAVYYDSAKGGLVSAANKRSGCS